VPHFLLIQHRRNAVVPQVFGQQNCHLRHVSVFHLTQARRLRLLWQLVQLERAGHGHAWGQPAAHGVGNALFKQRRHHATRQLKVQAVFV
jgi:hypothetical protein